VEVVVAVVRLQQWPLQLNASEMFPLQSAFFLAMLNEENDDDESV
jgi:hypothetical protein